jgi:predicted Zn-dependent protease
MLTRTAFSWFALAAAVTLAAGCGRSDRPETTSSAGASTPVVTGSSSGTDSATGTRPTVEPVTYERAESIFGSGDYSEAARLFSLYAEGKPENPWGHYMLGLSAWKSGDHERALSAFDRSLEVDSTHRKSLFNSSRVLLEMDRAQEALERIEKGLGQEPLSNEGLRLLGRARHELGRVDGAVEAYQRALAADDRDVWSMNNLGLIYIEQDRSKEAIPPLARAVQLRSTSPVFQNNLGIALERSGYPLAAAKAYEAAIAVDSTYKKAAVSLARITGSGQEPEAEPIDLEVLAQEFQGQIGTWQSAGVAGDSTETTDTVTDSSEESVQPVQDSTTSSIDSSVKMPDDTIPSDHGA